MAAPPVIKIGPPPAKSGGGIGSKLDAMLKTHGPNWRQYEPLILKWASVYKIDPLYLGAVLLTENAQANPNARSSTGAVGPAQIQDSSVNQNLNPDAIWDGPAVLSDQWKQNFNNAVKYAAWRMAGQIRARGSLDSAYAGGYNTTAYKGPPPSHFLPSGYVPTTGPGTQPTPAEGAGPSVAGTQARHTLTDPWVVVTNTGQIKTVKSVDAPKNAVKDGTGQAYTLSQFNAVGRSLDSVYMAYTGRRANALVIAGFIANPVSTYELQQRLSNPTVNPRFYKSPVWQTHEPAYEAVYKNIFGGDADVTTAQAKQALTYGVVHNLDQTAFEQYLRDQPGYENSEEFKANSAQFRARYEAIYGTPDQVGEQAITDATKKGMNADQWDQFLRSQPEYTQSGEFQRNVYALLDNLGLRPGMTPTALQAPTVQAQVPTPSMSATGTPGVQNG